jgi:hypothetical protein
MRWQKLYRMTLELSIDVMKGECICLKVEEWVHTPKEVRMDLM